MWRQLDLSLCLSQLYGFLWPLTPWTSYMEEYEGITHLFLASNQRGQIPGLWAPMWHSVELVESECGERERSFPSCDPRLGGYCSPLLLTSSHRVKGKWGDCSCALFLSLSIHRFHLQLEAQRRLLPSNCSSLAAGSVFLRKRRSWSIGLAPAPSSRRTNPFISQDRQVVLICLVLYTCWDKSSWEGRQRQPSATSPLFL